MDERKLLLLIKNYPEVYNPQHHNYKRFEVRNAAWEAIALEMNEDAEACNELYISLRLEYQNFVRKLRKWFQSKTKGARPEMKYEKEMIFLWRFIPDRCFKRKSKKSVENGTEEKPSVVTKKPLTPELEAYHKKLMSKGNMKKLLTFIEEYPEIYDVTSKHFGNPIRLGIIWNAIGEELREESWKCIKTWIHLNLEFQYLCVLRQDGRDVNQLAEFSSILQFEEQLSFVKPLFDCRKVKNSQTYKLSPDSKKYIRTLAGGVEEYIFLSIVKQYPQLYRSNGSENLKLSDVGYLTIWKDVAKRVDRPASTCEQTWVVLKSLYDQIKNLRKGGNPLRDKWDSEDFMDVLMRDESNVKQKIQPNDKPSFSTIYQQFIEKDVEMSLLKSKQPMETQLSECLIKYVKNYPQLYRRRHTNKISSSDILWNMIGRQLNISGAICKESWNALKCRYDSYRTNPGKEVFPHYQAMSFLNRDPADDPDPLQGIWIKNKNLKQNYSQPPPQPTTTNLPSAKKGTNGTEIKDNPKTEVRMSSELLLALVKEVKKNSILYNYTHRNYYNKTLRQKVYSSIGSRLNVDATLVENTWTKLKLNYWRYLAHDPLLKNCDIKKFIWPLKEELNFLQQYRYSATSIDEGKSIQTNSMSPTESSSSSPVQYVQIVEVSSTQNQDYEEENAMDVETQNSEGITNDSVAVSSSDQLAEIAEIDLPETPVEIDRVNMLIFMSIVKKNPVIYDPNHRFFHSKLDRLNAWTRISSELKCTLYECDLMWNDVVQKFLKYKEVDPEFKLPINSRFWRDMIHMYTRKNGICDEEAELESNLRCTENEFEPMVHTMRGKVDDHFKNLARAVDTLPPKIQEILLDKIKTVTMKVAKKYDESLVEVICVQ